MTPDREAALVRAVLDDLARIAGVSPADGSPDAARAVAAVLPAGERGDPLACALAVWLRAATGITGAIEGVGPALLVTSGRVLVLGARLAGGGRERRTVELTPAVRAAVRLTDAPHLVAAQQAARRLHRKKEAA